MKRINASLVVVSVLVLGGCLGRPASPPAVVAMNSASVTVALTVPVGRGGGAQPLNRGQQGNMQLKADQACVAQGRTAGESISTFTKCIEPGGYGSCYRYEVSRLYPCKG